MLTDQHITAHIRVSLAARNRLLEQYNKLISPVYCASRKQLVTILAPLVVYSGNCTAAEVPPSPPYGSCTDCIGELNGTLNACTLNSASCVSSQNEDEDHFMAPWQYSSSTNAAVDSLVAVATGKDVTGTATTDPQGAFNCSYSLCCVTRHLL